MILPEEEKRVLEIFQENKDKKYKSIEIARMLGLYDTHVNKLIKFLRDKGYWIENDYAVVDGKSKKYKLHWISSEAHRGAFLGCDNSRVKLQGWRQDNKNCPHCGMSWYRINEKCNKCRKEVKCNKTNKEEHKKLCD